MEKSIWLQNAVTGDKYRIIYGATGKVGAAKQIKPSEPGYVTQRFPTNQGELQLRYVGKNMTLSSLTGEAAKAGHLGASQPYYLQNGKIVSALVGTPTEIAVCKLGDKYLGARCNEFGHANYEIVPAVAAVSPLGACLTRTHNKQ